MPEQAIGSEAPYAALKEDPFLLFPRPIDPTPYDSIIGACRKAGFKPVIAQLVPQLAAVITLVAADLGVSIVPVSMSQLQITGAAYRAIAGDAPIAPLALAYRRGKLSATVRNFIARAVAYCASAIVPSCNGIDTFSRRSAASPRS
jgi:DNA-binding transcriptional LysR family regulator